MLAGQLFFLGFPFFPTRIHFPPLTLRMPIVGNSIKSEDWEGGHTNTTLKFAYGEHEAMQLWGGGGHICNKTSGI
jgi:hypothetical protein